MTGRDHPFPAGPATCSVGIDVGGTTTRVVAFAPDRAVLAESVFPTPPGAALVDGLAEAVRRVGAGRRLAHVGVGIPGRVTADGTVDLALNVGLTAPLPLATRLASEVGAPVIVDNDVNVAALAALEALGGESLTYVSVGTGLAVGSIIAGSIVTGSTGIAGELGHLPLPGDTTPCGCGQVGCIEAVVSGRALAAAAAELGLGPRPTAVDVWDAADRGHTGAAALRQRVVAALAWVCQAAVLMLDVEHVVLGGGVAELGPRLGDPVADELRRREARSAWLAAVGPSRRLRPIPTGGHLGAVGADLAARRRARD